MKQLITTLTLILIGQLVFAQNLISYYSFNQSIGEYTELTGATVLPLESSTHYPEFYVEDEGKTVATDIGFEFTYGDNTYTQFRASANGFISIGDIDFTDDAQYRYYIDYAKYQIIAPLAGDFWLLWENDASVSYKLEGTVGTQILTIQFKNLREFGDYTQTGADYQIKLYEATSKIEIIYGDMSGATTWQFGQLDPVQCGIADAPTPDGTYFLINPGYPCDTTTTGWYPNLTESQIAAIIEGTTYTFIPVLDYDAMPLSIDINDNIQYNEELTLTATFENHGTETITFDATIEIINSDETVIFTQTETITELAGRTSQQINFTPNWTAEAGDFTVKAYTNLSNDAYTENDILTKEISVNYLKKAYCYVQWSEGDNYPTGSYWFYLEEPEDLNLISAGSDGIFNGTWTNDKWYSIEFSSQDLVYIDAETGAKTVVGNTVNHPLIFKGLSYDWSTETMYAMSGHNSETFKLYTINLTTGEATLVGEQANPTATLETLACDINGNLYTLGEDSKLYSINKETAELTEIGSLGLSSTVYGGQDMEFDHYSGNLYWYGMLNNGVDAMYIINTETGVATATSASFQYQVQFCGFAIPYEPETTFDVTFEISDDLEPVINFAGYGEQTATGGTTTYTGVAPAQSPGIQYTATLEGYNTYTAYLVVDNNEAVNITLQPEGETFDVTFNITDGLEPNITLGSFETQIATGGTYTFTEVAETPDPGMSYVIELDGYETITDYVVIDENETVNITLTATEIENIDKNLINIYPNPSNGIFTIENLQASARPCSVSITDITGKTLYNYQLPALSGGEVSINNSQSKLDLSNQPSGIYFLTIKTKTDIYTEKILKK